MMRNKRFDQIVGRTARRLSKELERMWCDLDKNDPNDAASDAFECVLITLKRRRPDLMGWLELGMSFYLAEMQRRTQPAVLTETAYGETIH
jgi:hypothetical protein